MKSIIICILSLYLTFNTQAQTKPINHWQLGGSVGYATSIQEDYPSAHSDLNIQGDSVIGLIPGNYRYGTISGLQINLEANWQKNGEGYTADKYPMGAVYMNVGAARLGNDSEHIRHMIQKRFAHSIRSKYPTTYQPWFRYRDDISSHSYFQYQSNPFSLW
jgi:hypothetical protein